MKYLKLYEMYNQNELWEQISPNDVTLKLRDKQDIFDSSEVNRLKSFVNGICSLEVKVEPYLQKNLVFIRSNSKNSNYNEIGIYKLEDDWYIVYF